jgi:hypothetical protein
MPDPLRKVHPGQELADNITAAAWNAFVDAAAAHRAGQLAQLADAFGAAADSSIIVIRNDSGGARDRYDILALSNVVFTPADNLNSFQTAVAWIGSLPTLAHVGKFALLLEPAATSRFARAAIGGTWVTKIQVDHVQHTHADVAPSSARLTSNWFGSVEILYKESGTGEKWGVVRFGSEFWGPLRAVVTETGGIAADGSGEVTIYTDDAVISSPAATVTAWLDWMHAGRDALEDEQGELFWRRKAQRYAFSELGCTSVPP